MAERGPAQAGCADGGGGARAEAVQVGWSLAAVQGATRPHPLACAGAPYLAAALALRAL